MERTFALLQAEIEAHHIPGAVMLVARGDELLVHQAFGMAHPAEGRPMRPDTLFDLASLTKVVATLPSILLLLEDGLLRLDDPVSRFLPSFAHQEIRIRHLLAHTSGLPSGAPLQAFTDVYAVPLKNSVGAQVLYSDVGFILLGLVVEALSGLPLDRFFAQRVAEPLGLSSTCFRPGRDKAPVTAATEYREHLGRHQCAEVHDENATRLGGVAGHAGLFGTAEDIWRYARMWLDGNLLSRATRQEASRCHTDRLNDRRALGWALRDYEFSSAGDLLSFTSFGHTGFTGTSLWVDPERRLIAILLTNRVFYGRHDHIIRLRPRFHNTVVASLE